MAKRRMVAISVVHTDAFLNLKPASRALYFHLMLSADDDGFIGCTHSVLRMANVPASALKPLQECGFVHAFASGVLVIMHWHVHNNLRRDRYTPTLHRKEAALLTLGEDDVYRLREPSPAAPAPEQPPEPAPRTPQPENKEIAETGAVPGQKNVLTPRREQEGKENPENPAQWLARKNELRRSLEEALCNPHGSA